MIDSSRVSTIPQNPAKMDFGRRRNLCRLVLVVGCLLVLSGCTIRFEYIVTGKIVRNSDGVGVENAAVRLETNRGSFETHTDETGEFQLLCEFLDPDYDSGRTTCRLIVQLPNGRDQTLDVTPKKRPEKGIKDELRVLVCVDE